MESLSILAEPSVNKIGLQVESIRLLLEQQGRKPIADGPYYRCGQGWELEGWRLHIAVTRSYFKLLIDAVLPLLNGFNVSFCLFKDRWAGNTIVNGGFGIELQGKALSILPVNGEQACEIAEVLVSVTSAMKGPDVPGAYFLGGRVYAEYVRQGENGSFDIGRGSKGLLQFFQNFEFVLPRGVIWPFDGVAAYHAPKRKMLLQGRYLFVDMLKTDAKGHVMLAWQLRWGIPVRCVVKEGLVGINEDDAGRDATDRIRWQAHMASRVKGHILTAEVLAYFKIGRKAYLVTRWIPSTELSVIFEQILAGRSWPDLGESHRLRIKQYLIKVLYPLVGLHELGIIHRDVTPFNFRVDARDQVWLLDLEQCFDRQRNQPTPPFGGDTPGYKSDLEMSSGMPGPEEDVFGFGGLMIFAATGIYPHHFMGLGDKSRAFLFLTGDQPFTDLLSKCRLPDPADRPPMDVVVEAVKTLPTKSVSGFANQNHVLTEEELKDIVIAALAGLHHPVMHNSDGYWKSVDKNQKILFSGQSTPEVFTPGLYDGLGGVLLIIFKAIRCHIRWSFSPDDLNKNISYLLGQLSSVQGNDSGLWHGTAGMHMVVLEGIRAGVFQGHEQRMLGILEDCRAAKEVLNEIDLSYGSGLAGQMVSLLTSDDMLWREEATRIAMSIGGLQQTYGNWKNTDYKFSQGSAGIIWSLLVYLQHDPRVASITDAVRKALQHLTREIFRDNGQLRDITSPWLDGSAGLALTYLKAFQVLGERTYLETATQILMEFPERIASNMLTAGDGLASVGETYMYAWRVTGDNFWKERAGRIAQLFGHLFYRPQDGIGWWTTDRPLEPSPSLFTGSGGPLYFLLNYLYPEQMTGIIPGT